MAYCSRNIQYFTNLNIKLIVSKQDYLTFIPDLAEFVNLDAQVGKGKFKDNVGPLITLVGNNGFEYMIG